MLSVSVLCFCTLPKFDQSINSCNLHSLLLDIQKKFIWNCLVLKPSSQIYNSATAAAESRHNKKLDFSVHCWNFIRWTIILYYWTLYFKKLQKYKTQNVKIRDWPQNSMEIYYLLL